MTGIILCGRYLWQIDEKCNDGNISVAALVALGAENGCDFTFENLLETAELSEKELDGPVTCCDLNHILGPKVSAWTSAEGQPVPAPEAAVFRPVHRIRPRETTPNTMKPVITGTTVPS